MWVHNHIYALSDACMNNYVVRECGRLLKYPLHYIPLPPAKIKRTPSTVNLY